jgi:ankyrin repeat protein
MSAELLDAIDKGNFDKALALLKATPTLINASDNTGKNALMRAASQDNTHFLDALLELNPDLENTDELGRTPLIYATAKGNLDNIMLLVEKGANLHAKTIDGKSIAHFAGLSGNLEFLEYLHMLNFDLTQPDPTGMNALRYATDTVGNHEVLLFAARLGIFPTDFALDIAIKLSDTEALDLLLEMGSITLNDAFCATAKEGKNELVEFLYKKGLDVNYQNSEGHTALHLAAASGNADTVDFLLKNGANIELKSKTGGNILHFAAISSNPELLRDLIEKADDASISASYDEDNSQVLPIHLAARSGNVEVFKILFENQANTYVKDKTGKSILDYAVESRNPASVNYAFSKEATELHYDSDGRSVLHLAAFDSSPDLNPAFAGLKHFIDHLDNDGYSAFHLAVYQKNKDFIQYLLTIGANINSTNKYGETALHLAIEGGNLDIIAMLIDAKADLLITNQYGDTPLHVAINLGNIEAIKLLIANKVNKEFPNKEGLTPLQEYLRTPNPQPLIIEALGYDPKQILAADKPKPNIDQNRLNHKLVEYSTKNGFDPPLLDDKGNCSGWAMLFPYYVSINREEEFYDMLYYISNWDGNTESLKNDTGLSDSLKSYADGRVKYKNGTELFEQIISNLSLFQITKVSDIVTGITQINRQAQWDLITNHETDFNVLFGMKSDGYTLKSIKDYLDIAKNHPGLTLDFGIYDNESGHAISLYVTEEGKFKFYDSNFVTRQPASDSTESMARLIINTIEKSRAFDLQFSQFLDLKKPIVSIDSQKLLSELATINPILGQAVVMNALRAYPNDLEQIKRDVNLLVKNGIAFDQESFYRTSPFEYAKTHCDEDVLALLEDAMEKIKRQAASASAPKPMDIERSPVTISFNISMSDLKREYENLDPKILSQSSRAQMVFSNKNEGPSITSLGIEREEQLQKLVSVFETLAMDPSSRENAKTVYDVLCAIKDKTNDPSMTKLCEKYTVILLKEQPSLNLKEKENTSSNDKSKPTQFKPS